MQSLRTKSKNETSETLIENYQNQFWLKCNEKYSQALIKIDSQAKSISKPQNPTKP